jgi:DNA-binding MarR family transcriptional regulator
VLRALADLLVLAEPLQQRLWDAACLSVGQLRVLRVLSEQHAAIPAGRLAALAGISQASLSRLLAKLEQRELVRRDVDAEDRRRVGVSLTPAGEQLLESSRLWRGSEFDRAAAELSPAERQAFVEAVGVFAERVRVIGKSA